MEKRGATAEPVRIRILYNRVEEAEAAYLGAYPDGAGELFRVSRPSLSVAGVAREDVVRLERHGDTYAFLGVFERSSWETQRLLLPREVVRTPDIYPEFERAVTQAGCIIEEDSFEPAGLRLIISVPAGVAANEWTSAYERAVQQSTGLSVAAFEARVADEARREALAQSKRQRAQLRRQIGAQIARMTPRVLLAATSIAVVGWWVLTVVTSAVAARPRVAALGMIVPLSPLVIASLWDRSVLRLTLLLAAAAVAAWMLAGTVSDPTYASFAVALGVVFAVVVGGIGVFFGLATVFTESSRDRRPTWFLVVLPCLASAIAAVVYAATAAYALHIQLAGLR
jgi:hypothetical protein